MDSSTDGRTDGLTARRRPSGAPIIHSCNKAIVRQRKHESANEGSYSRTLVCTHDWSLEPTQPWQCRAHAAFELFAKQLKIVKIHYGKFAREVVRLGRSLLLLLLILFLLVLLLLLQEGRCSQALLLLLRTERGLGVGGAARVTLALWRMV